MRTHSFQNTETATKVGRALINSWKPLPVGSFFNYVRGKKASEMSDLKLAAHILYSVIVPGYLLLSLGYHSLNPSQWENTKPQNGLENKVHATKLK